MAKTVCIIGGAMRSGTTVIHRCLCTGKNTNPYISESWFLADLMRIYRWNLTRYDTRNLDQFGDVENFKNLIWSDVREYLSYVSIKYHDPEVLMLKHPELTYHFVELYSVFKEFKFIAIVRDPRDVVASMIKVKNKHEENSIISPQTETKTIKGQCSAYLNYYINLLKYSEQMKSRLLFIKYEDFVTNPSVELNRVTEFTGASYDTSIATEFLPEHAKSPNLIKENRLKDNFSGAFWSDDYQKSITSKNIGQYKNILNTSEIREIENLLGAFGVKFNYW
jgi:protein-tyrosine sulfotransferase